MKTGARSKNKRIESLTPKMIEAITEKASQRSDIPLVVSKQINMRLSIETIARARKIAEAQGKPLTTFISGLVRDDVERLWAVFRQ